FFFSSRRRHTRSKRDWSSDVCSSDLIEVKMSISQKTSSSSELEAGASLSVQGGFGPVSVAFAAHVNYKSSNTYSYSAEGSSLLRSEERRVGKECRSRWSRSEERGVGR